MISFQILVANFELAVFIGERFVVLFQGEDLFSLSGELLF